jgi:hypothetical protein
MCKWASLTGYTIPGSPVKRSSFLNSSSKQLQNNQKALYLLGTAGRSSQLQVSVTTLQYGLGCLKLSTRNLASCGAGRGFEELPKQAPMLRCSPRFLAIRSDDGRCTKYMHQVHTPCIPCLPPYHNPHYRCAGMCV